MPHVDITYIIIEKKRTIKAAIAPIKYTYESFLRKLGDFAKYITSPIIETYLNLPTAKAQ